MILRIGNNSEDVRDLQLKLNKLGEKLIPDGIFGSGTESAVKRFQVANGLQVDGIAGLMTMTILNRLVPSEPTPSPAAPVIVPSSASDLQQAILNNAAKFIGLTEIQDNAAWANPDDHGMDFESDVLKKMMEDIGWESGWPYCISFADAIYKKSYTDLAPKYDASKAIFTQNMSVSVMASFNAFNGIGRITQQPVPGAIFFMQMGNGATGHAGIVVSSTDTAIQTIEANTSPGAGTPQADREGDGIYPKTRILASFQKKKNGLWLRGFLNPF